MNEYTKASVSASNDTTQGKKTITLGKQWSGLEEFNYSDTALFEPEYKSFCCLGYCEYQAGASLSEMNNITYSADLDERVFSGNYELQIIIGNVNDTAINLALNWGSTMIAMPRLADFLNKNNIPLPSGAKTLESKLDLLNKLFALEGYEVVYDPEYEIDLGEYA